MFPDIFPVDTDAWNTLKTDATGGSGRRTWGIKTTIVLPE
jgi:hypothetical protein